MPTAYVFLHCRSGTENDIISEIAKVPDVMEVRGTYGIHDIFVKVRSKDMETMNSVITLTIRRIPNITSTNTLIVIEEQGGKE
jgi:DNA-binding Lrp family transcriptional regulator